MSTFKRCDGSVEEMASELINQFDTHAPLIECKVKIDYVFAYGDRDEATGELKSTALKLHGVAALGIARKMPLKDRALGRGDAEISLDGDWWKEASDAERRALLDHELHHLVPTYDTDDLRRPIIKIRPHDFQFGWFKVIAARHGIASQERIQAKAMMDDAGQYFWPLDNTATAQESRFQNLEMTTH